MILEKKDKSHELRNFRAKKNFVEFKNSGLLGLFWVRENASTNSNCFLNNYRVVGG